MTSSQNASLTLKLALALCLLVIGIVMTDLTGRALTGTLEVETQPSTSDPLR